MKTIGNKPELISVCVNETGNIIVMIRCEVRTKRTGEECELMYLHTQDFENKCDSRFTLKSENQTVFLHLTDLKPVDSGNYTCQCTYSKGMDEISLNITVEGKLASYLSSYFCTSCSCT